MPTTLTCSIWNGIFGEKKTGPTYNSKPNNGIDRICQKVLLANLCCIAYINNFKSDLTFISFLVCMFTSVCCIECTSKCIISLFSVMVFTTGNVFLVVFVCACLHVGAPAVEYDAQQQKDGKWLLCFSQTHITEGHLHDQLPGELQLNSDIFVWAVSTRFPSAVFKLWV